MNPPKEERFMFTPDDIHARLRAQPFIPLRVVTSLGQNYDITHPDWVLIGRQSLMIGIASPENPTQLETATRIALMHITDLQDMPRSI
jgi:hypothetical protein